MKKMQMDDRSALRRLIRKSFLIMRLTFFLIVLGVLQSVAASVYAQNWRFSLDARNISVREVLEKIEDESEFRFFYEDKLDVDQKLNLKVENSTIDEVLDQLLAEAGIEYKVMDNNFIVLKRNEKEPGSSEIQQTKPIRISGIVTDAGNAPLTGVTVVIKGTSVGTVTDSDGKYTLSVDGKEKVLVFSFIGMKSQEIPIGDQSVIDVKMAEDAIGLDEVVAVGYGVVKKSDLTGSVVSLKTQEITNTPANNALEALQGKVSGLDLTRSSGEAGASMNFTIHGNRSLNASNTPLVLVDGIAYGSYIDINPNDIASVEVLKDASSTAIYGSRGANGVIIITTKQGKTGRTKVEFNSYAGYNLLTNYQKVGDTEYYKAMTREAYREDGQWSSEADDATIFAGNYENIKEGIYTDWTDLMLHNGKVQNYYLALSGGNEKTSFRLSSEYYNEQGLLKNNDLDRFVQHLNLEHHISDKFSVGTNMTFKYSENEKRNTSFWNLIKLLPFGEPYNDDGSINEYPWPSSVDLNPLYDESKDNYRNLTTGSRLFWVAYADWNILKGLNFHSNFALDLNYSKQGIFEGTLCTQSSSNSGYSHAEIVDLDGKNWTWENTLTYNKEIGAHSITAMLGNTMSKSKTVSFSAGGYDQAFESASFYNLGTNTVDLYEESDLTESQLASFFGRLNYKFNERYLATFSVRADGSSVLAEGNKWAYFPSVALAWKIKNEEFMAGATWLSDLKIRTSYGVSGNSAIDPYQTQGGVSKLRFAFDETPAFGYMPTSISNKDLSWEKTATMNAGVDFGLFNGRLSGSIDVYKTKTSDLLMESILPVTTGYSSIIANIGKTATKGLDILISSRNISTSKFSWNTDFNFSTVKEKIVELSVGGDDVTNGWFVGHPINVLYDYEKIGIWQTDEATNAESYGHEPGEIKVKDQNNDGLLTAADDRKILGQESPKWSAGLTNTFTYKNFSLSVLIYARVGQMISSDYLGFWYANGIFNTAVVDYWTPENPTNAYPRPNLSTDKYISTLSYIDGSFWKIKDIRLSYNITKKVVKHLPVNSITVYGTAKNFFTFSKLKDYDPERGGSVDYPLTKQVVFGVNFDL